MGGDGRALLGGALLQHRADPNAHKNGTPLVAISISLMSLPMLRLFLSHGADPNARFNDVPLLHLAVHKGYAEAQALLAAGADVRPAQRIHRPLTARVCGNQSLQILGDQSRSLDCNEMNEM